jgi:subtilisin family serine protease
LQSLRYEGARDALGHLRASGRGVGVAILDSGVAPHADIEDRLLDAVSTVPDCPSPVDFIGHGTLVSSLAAGDGKTSSGRFCGVAPHANLVSVRVTAGADADLTAPERYGAVLSGLQWVMENREKYNIRVVNVSVGYPLDAREDESGQQYLFDPLAAALEEATKQGLVIVVAAGNDGPAPGSLMRTPAVHPSVITVGSVDTNGTPTDPSDDRVAEFSSRGPGPGKGRPDLLASGVNLMGANVPHSEAERRNDQALTDAHKITHCPDEQLHDLARDVLLRYGGDVSHLQSSPAQLREYLLWQLDPKATSTFLRNGHAGYIARHGTSMSAPLVTGLVACMFEVNPDLTPAEVKDILTSTARRLPGVDANDQGAGVVDGGAALAEAARRRASNA